MTKRAVLVLALFSWGCENKPAPGSTGDERSPNARILPAPLTSARELISRPRPEPLPGSSAGPAQSGSAAFERPPQVVVTPELMALQSAPSADTLLPHEGLGVQIGAQLFWNAPPIERHPPTLQALALDTLREQTASRISITALAAGRLRFQLESGAAPLPDGVELRSRADLYGHVLLWPDQKTYRSLIVGTLRSAFGDRRVDTMPLVLGTSKDLGSGPVLLGLPTSKSEVVTNTGRVELLQAAVEGVGLGGSLLCRLLVEFMSVEPSSPVCQGGSLPVQARFEFQDGAIMTFRVEALAQKPEIDVELVRMPPRRANYVTRGLPGPADSGVFSDPDGFAALRKRETPRETPIEPDAPASGLLLVNGGASLQFFQLDGVDAGWVAAERQVLVPGLRAGKFQFRWRTFFGAFSKGEWIEVPARRRLEAPPFLEPAVAAHP